MTSGFALNSDLRGHFNRDWSFLINSREHNPIWEVLKPECRLEAAVVVDEMEELGSQAVCANGGGSSLVHKVCKCVYS